MQGPLLAEKRAPGNFSISFFPNLERNRGEIEPATIPSQNEERWSSGFLGRRRPAGPRLRAGRGDGRARSWDRQAKPPTRGGRSGAGPPGRPPRVVAGILARRRILALGKRAAWPRSGDDGGDAACSRSERARVSVVCHLDSPDGFPDGGAIPSSSPQPSPFHDFGDFGLLRSRIIKYTIVLEPCNGSK